jgi:hypothetical protein
MKVPLTELAIYARVGANSPDLLALLKAERAKHADVLNRADKNPLIFRSQGAVGALDQLIDLLENSAAHLQKLRP